MEQQTNLLNEFTEPTLEYASAGQRFLNYIIDAIAFYILGAIVGFILATAFSFSEESVIGLGAGMLQLLFLFLYVAIIILYYTVLEGAKGKTLGKLLTKTKVVREDGEPMTYGKACMRALCRFVPFEIFSAFFGVKMWHDSWTNTMVVKDR